MIHSKSKVKRTITTKLQDCDEVISYIKPRDQRRFTKHNRSCALATPFGRFGTPIFLRLHTACTSQDVAQLALKENHISTLYQAEQSDFFCICGANIQLEIILDVTL